MRSTQATERGKASLSPLLAPQTWLVLGSLGGITAIWAGLVNSIVTAPYLDEVFHVGQAQKYLQGRFHEWDPKITTPPGLYGLSWLLSCFIGFSSISSLRALNALLLPILVLLVTDADSQIESRHRGPSSASESRTLAQRLHMGLNVALFPPLFFFSALYYTDIASVVSVMLCWNHFIRLCQKAERTVCDDATVVILALFSLTFRQTNIFWVAVFPAAFIFVDRLDEIVKTAVGDEEPVADPAIREAHADDYLFFILSLVRRIQQAVFSLFRGDFSILRLVGILLPYLTILVAFTGFVIWNGGVVLGDKSNHIATIHLAQLLYMWPYMIFFSIPLMHPYLIQGVFACLGLLPIFCEVEYMLMLSRRAVLPSPFIIGIFCLVAAAIVKLNTIVHPFTLADNRHYTFYVFRRLLAHPAIRFLVIPIYAAASWATIQTLGAPTEVELNQRQNEKPQLDSSDKSRHPDNKGRVKVSRLSENQDPAPRHAKLNSVTTGQGPRASFVLIWLATSALQLVSAPLVEPRYFILPWLMWRLRVPQIRPDNRPDDRVSKTAVGSQQDGVLSWTREVKKLAWDEYDIRLWLETAWFLLINAVTGYIFLYRGFEWESEKGLVQRFMW